jgi:hypothetical protein
VQSDVNEFINGGSDEEAGVLLIIRRQVSAAAAEADAERGAGDNHREKRKAGKRESGNGIINRIEISAGFVLIYDRW